MVKKYVRFICYLFVCMYVYIFYILNNFTGAGASPTGVVVSFILSRSCSLLFSFSHPLQQLQLLSLFFIIARPFCVCLFHPLCAFFFASSLSSTSSYVCILYLTYYKNVFQNFFYCFYVCMYNVFCIVVVVIIFVFCFCFLIYFSCI